MGILYDSAFPPLAGAPLDAIEARFEAAADAADIDVELTRHGNVLEIAFDNGTQIIVNSQAAMQEIWLAARSGGFHFRPETVAGRAAPRWIGTRDGGELFDVLSRCASEQAGAVLEIAGDA